MVVLGEGGNFLSSKNVANGDKVKFTSEGEWIESARYKYDDGNPKVDFVIDIQQGHEAKKMRLNKTNREILTKMFGNDTAGWVGKEVTLALENIMIAGERKKTIVVNDGSEPEAEWT